MKNSLLNFWDFDTKIIRPESYKNFKNSIFEGIYEKALSSVEEIISHVERDTENQDNEINNIITFIGERGTGKTTAMVSFVNYLKNDIRMDTEWRENSQARKCNFQCVPLIDPSKLTAEENIITLVVAYIYEGIKQMAKEEKAYGKKAAGDRMERLKEGVRKCQEVYNVVRIKYTSFSKNMEQNPDTVETFSEIAKATRLRKLIQDLVDVYLDILNDGIDNKNSVLIIPIDDLDTNIQNAYTLAEDLRSYFMVSRVIIMMAVKLEQLNDVIQLKFCEEFKNLSGEGLKMDASAECMATKYLEKLIPHDRRIAMPSLLLQNLNNFNILVKNSDDGKKYSTYSKPFVQMEGGDMRQISEEPLVEYVSKLVYLKTGIILVKNEHNAHDFIPCNLRTLHQLLQMLETQKSVELKKIMELRQKGGCEGQILELQSVLQSNLSKMYNYLLDDSTSGNMPNELTELLRRLWQQPVDIMNSFLVRGLYDALGSTVTGEFIQNNPVIKNFAVPGVHPNLVTVGDVLYMLNQLQQADSEIGMRQFIMTVKIIYSIIVIRLLFAEGMQPQYAMASRLLGNMVCNPAVQLLPGGRSTYEWMPNIRGERIGIKIKDEIWTLDGQIIHDSQESLSIETAVRLSFFVAGYYRMNRTESFRQIDPHVYNPGDYPLVKYRRSAAEDINSSLLSFHWMSFVSLALNPEETIRAMLHCIINKEAIEQSEEYKAIIKQIMEWRDKRICAVPVYSMDTLNELIWDMHEKRYEYDDGTAKDKKLHGYAYFMESLEASLIAVWKRGPIGDNMEILDGFRECPILFEKKTIEDVEDELQWLNAL